MKKRLFQKEVLCVYVKKQRAFNAYIKANKRIGSSKVYVAQ